MKLEDLDVSSTCGKTERKVKDNAPNMCDKKENVYYIVQNNGSEEKLRGKLLSSASSMLHLS